MKICMGDKQAYGQIGSIEPHFGFPFQIQSDRTLMCEVPKEMISVANLEIANGRIRLYVDPSTPDPSEEKLSPAKKMQARRAAKKMSKTDTRTSQELAAAEKEMESENLNNQESSVE